LAQRVASKSPKQTNVLKKPVPESKRGKKRAKLADPEFAVEELPLPRVQPRPHASEAAKAPHVTPFDRLEDEDPIYVREYVEDIFIYLKEMEVGVSCPCMTRIVGVDDALGGLYEHATGVDVGKTCCTRRMDGRGA
jgi:hypothetical protein